MAETIMISQAPQEKIGVVPSGKTVQGQIDALNSKSLKNPTLLTSSDDMDNVGVGIYYQTNTSMPLHSPANQYNASIIVTRSTSSVYGLSQIWISNNTGLIHIRQRFSEADSWTNWEQLATSSNLIPKIIMPIHQAVNFQDYSLSEAYTNSNKIMIEILVEVSDGVFRSAIMELPVIAITSDKEFIVSITENSGGILYHGFIQIKFIDSTTVRIQGRGIDGWQYSTAPYFKIYGYK